MRWIAGSRTWEYVLLPLAPGEQAIPPISFSYFDPVAEEYRTRFIKMTGEEAREESLKHRTESTISPRIVHVATH